VFRLTNRRLSIPHLYLSHTYHITILFLFHPVLIKDDYDVVDSYTSLLEKVMK